jgi:serine protease Do
MTMIARDNTGHGRVLASRAALPLRTALTVALLATTALGGYAVGNAGLAADPAPQAPAAIQPSVTARMPDFADLVAQVKPAVLSITTKLRATPAAEQGGTLPFPFGIPGMPGMQGVMPRSQPMEARGSGFLIDADGTVVTNNHVVKGATSIHVTLDDGTVLPARVIGTDPGTDLAVLKINAGHKLPFIQLGDSAQVRPGQWVVAMGNPYGLGGTVTAGIVSARGRDIGEGPYDQFIQIDAPINRGNSGGPLFTQDGKVIGINTAILSPSGGSIGIGFAIPSNTVKQVVDQLQHGGHVTRGFLGVEAQPVNSDMAAALHLPQQADKSDGVGALVAAVEPESPAAHAGLEPGDVITEVGGKPVANARDLALKVADLKPGAQVELSVVRDGTSRTMNATIATKQDGQTADSNSDGGGQARIGLALQSLTPDLRDQLEVPEQTRGAVVTQVEPGSPAQQAGLRPGDVVVGVGTHSVSSAEEAVSAIHSAAAAHHAVALRIMRNGHAAFVAVDMSKNSNSDQG